MNEHYRQMFAPRSLFRSSMEDLPEGDFVEVGVWKGTVFKEMLKVAQEQHRTAHAVDSFRGMAPPGPKDSDFYPEGKFDLGGVESFLRGMRGCSGFKAWDGFVPEVLQRIPLDVRFAFMRIDLDHHQPTLDAARWGWEGARLVPGGVLAFDDWFPNMERNPCTEAIRAFLAEVGGQYSVLGEEGRGLYIRRESA